MECLLPMIKNLLAIAVCAFALGANAEDLGVKSQTFAPDRDAREQIKDILRQKEKSGELAAFWNDYRNKSVNGIKNPAPLGIPSNYGFSAQGFNLKYIISQDYKDEKGNVVVPKGTVVEPLKRTPLTVGLIFIDGRDQRQVDYAIAAGKREPLKIVLVAGSPYDLRVKYKDADWNGSPTIPFYFDQKKMIINQFNRLYRINIDKVPAKLTQRGTQLWVEFGMSN